MYEAELNDIQKFLQKLKDSEVELLYQRYECGRTFETIGELVGYDQAAIQKKIRTALLKY